MSTHSPEREVLYPLLRRDVICIDTGDGALLRHADDAFILRGRGVYVWFSAIAPLLDGRRSVGDLQTSLPDPQHAMFDSLIDVLHNRKFIRHHVRDDTVLPEDYPYTAQVEFIRHFADDPIERFSRFRQASVMILGEGPTTDSIVRTLESNGLMTAASVANLPADSSSLGNHDVVVALGHETSTAQVRAAADAALVHNTTMLPCLVAGPRVFVGPFLHDRAGMSIDTVLARIGAGLDGADEAQFWRGVSGVPSAAHRVPAGAHEEMIGSLIGFELFRFLTGALPPETDATTIVQNLDTFDVVSVPVLTHPADPIARAHVTDIDVDALKGAMAKVDFPEDERVAHDLHEQAAAYLPLVRQYAGVFREFVDYSADQSPLKIGAVAVGAVHDDLLGPSRPSVMVGFHAYTPLQARFRALCSASLAYVDTWGPTSSLHITPEAQVDLAQLDVRSGIGALGPTPGITARSLLSGAHISVPAAAVYPWSHFNARAVVPRTSIGAGAGASLAEAVLNGLQSAVTHRALSRKLRSGTPLNRIDIGQGTGSPLLHFLRETVRDLEVDVTALDISAVPHASTVLLHAVHAERTITVTKTELSMERAIISALVPLIGQVSAAESLNTWAAKLGNESDITDLDPTAFLLSDVTSSPEGPLSTLPDLIRSLSDEGDVLVVDTSTHDLSCGGIHTVRVLLTRDAEPTAEGRS